ncbi:GIY-YIG nuclease family protein [Maribacter caenipelagi]|uniref:GIY-YIG nuclease family protein n=1 Tax=Maribacter caenipelagi TaxID=1447781 RepID=UPI00105FA002|nr:GIY-YIG nuclease family protein [Maribacter caenipelagi]
MSHTYILHSKALNKFYIGACHEDLQKRIENHNLGTYGTKSYTSITNDWVLF